MAGKGPPPKDPRLRQRRNRKPGAARIEAAGLLLDDGVPDLFERRCSCGGVVEAPVRKRLGRPPKPRPPCEACAGTGLLPWHRLTLAWWRGVWTSEVASRYLRVDLHGLFRLAVLVDRYWCESDQGLGVRELGAEIRLQQQAYGLSPLDRSRLQWEVEPAKPKGEDEQHEEPPPVLDSRKVLRALA